MSSKKLNRKELYGLVWKMPMTRLAKELELSDIGLAKTCKRYNIPRPARGYWAKKAAGHTMKKDPLPEGENAVIEFDLEGNRQRRKSFKSVIKRAIEAKTEVEVAVTKKTHPLAQVVANFFETAATDEFGRKQILRKSAPRIIAAPANTDRITQFISALAHTLDEKGIKPENGDKEKGLFFTCKGDKVQLSLEEVLEDYELEPSDEQKRKPSWTWNNKRTRPSGFIRIQMTSPQGTSGRCKWLEQGSQDLMHYLPSVVARFEALFERFEEKREATRKWEERQRQQHLQYEQEQKIRKHNDTIIETLGIRRRNLLLASEQYQMSLHIQEFANACLQHWGGNEEVLTSEQRDWLDWAQKTARAMNPISDGYPDPVEDGGFNPGEIPMGGPYPNSKHRKLPFILAEIDGMLSRYRSSSFYGHRTW